MQGENGPRTTHGDGSETKAGKCDKCLNTQEASGTKGRFSCTPSYPRQWRRRCPSPPWQRGRGPRPAPRPTSRHQSAREETGENKKSLKIVMFDSQEYRQDRPQGLKKKKINIQKIRPGCSAIQWHCGLRLFFKKYTSTTGKYCRTLIFNLYVVKMLDTFHD